MPEIGTSGLMSGERKRSVAAWPKLPRLYLELYLRAKQISPQTVGKATVSP